MNKLSNWKHPLWLALTWSVLGLFGAAYAQPHEQFMRGLESFDARFDQIVTDENGNLIEASSGSVALTKPNLFRWHYEAPFEQTIVADGRQVWVYEPDLQQVTVRSQAEAEAQSPLALLTDPVALNNAYAIDVLPEVGGIEISRLTPKHGEGELEFIDLGFEEGVLVALVIKDGFGQRTEVRLNNQCRNQLLAAGLFQFAPPPGVDIIGQQELLQPSSAPES